MVRIGVVHDREGVRGMSARAELVELLSRKTSILLDFDGPVCSIFSNHPAPGVAETLRGVLTGAGVTIPADLATEPDPLDVLKWTAGLGRADLLREVESRLCAEEAEAALVAQPTPFGRELIIGVFEAGKALAIVSNNSAGAINRYLSRQRLTRYGIPVSGRVFARPDLMKPNPEPILAAIKAINTSPADSVLIGDSLADIDGAHAAGVAVIGYANRPEKVDRFANAGADLIVTSMAEVASATVELRV
jgi:beta-phosphoglucomutase-like phosphatase (HAD superfamily)